MSATLNLDSLFQVDFSHSKIRRKVRAGTEKYISFLYMWHLYITIRSIYSRGILNTNWPGIWSGSFRKVCVVFLLRVEGCKMYIKAFPQCSHCAPKLSVAPLKSSLYKWLDGQMDSKHGSQRKIKHGPTKVSCFIIRTVAQTLLLVNCFPESLNPTHCRGIITNHNDPQTYSKKRRLVPKKALIIFKDYAEITR